MDLEIIEFTPAQEARVRKLMSRMGFGTGTKRQKGGSLIGGAIDDTIWVCTQCDYHIGAMEYEHLNKDGNCINCGEPLVQFEPVEGL